MTEFEQLTIAQGTINLVIQGVLAVGSIGIVLLALYGDWIKDRWFGPNLRLSIQLEPPYCQRILGGTWFRIKVENMGRTSARDVELWVVELSRVVNGVFLEKGLVPIPLRWTHTDETRAGSVNPSFHRYVDFGYLEQKSAHPPYEEDVSQFVIALVRVPKNMSSRLAPGNYSGRFAVTASNAPARYWNFRFDVPDTHMQTEAEALRHVNLRII